MKTETQFGLFGGQEITNGGIPDDVPQDVKDALAICTGIPPDEIIQDRKEKEILSEGGFAALANEINQHGPVPGRLHEYAKHGLLKNSDRVERVERQEGMRIEAFDVANEAEANKLAELLEKINAPNSVMQGAMLPPKTKIDPKSPRGFRVIIVLKYWNRMMDLKLPPAATQIPSAAEQMRMAATGPVPSTDVPIKTVSE